jgi:hypothetical protein
MPALKILCTRNTPSSEPHLRISHIGVANNGNLPWTLTVDEAIRTLDLEHYSYYVMIGTRRADGVLAYAPSGAKYLRCSADNGEVHALDSLPDCA